MKHLKSLKAAKANLQSKLDKIKNTSNIETIAAFVDDAIKQYFAVIGTANTTYATDLAELEAFKGCPKSKAKNIEEFKANSATELKEIAAYFQKMNAVKKDNQAKLDLLQVSKSALTQLEAKMGTLDKHQTDYAYDSAKELLFMLNEAQQNFVEQAGKTPASKATSDYKANFTAAITSKIHAFDNDISWTEFFKNILKTIANAVITTVTFGTKQSFFPYAVSEAKQAASDVTERFAAASA